MAIDQSAVQRLKNTIQDGELTLRTGKFNRRKLSKLEINALKDYIKKSKLKLKTISKPTAKKAAKKVAPKKAAKKSTAKGNEGNLVYVGTGTKGAKKVYQYAYKKITKKK